MKLTSSAFYHNEKIPEKYTCDGENINPPLDFIDIPDGTMSLVLILEDPDVPGSIREDHMWDHWVIFNIPPTVTHIEEGVEPPCTYGLGTGNNQTYRGPCPADREHRYFFKLFALDTSLALPENSTKKQIEHAMDGHVIAKTELMGTYARPK